MGLNIGGLNLGSALGALGSALTAAITGKAELESGQDVTVPVDLEIGTDQGKPLYLKLVVTETKPV